MYTHHHHHRHHHEASLEILTDGSELTDPAIFLTIRRSCNDNSHNKNRRYQNGDREVANNEVGNTNNRQDDDYDDYDADNNDDESLQAHPTNRTDRSCTYYYKEQSRNIERDDNNNNNGKTVHDNDNDDDDDAIALEEEGTIVARYNLSGLPSLTGRLSSDQSFKLLQGGAFRAVLLPSLVGSFHVRDTTTTTTTTNWNTPNDYGSSNKKRCASLGGLPALLLNLIQAGYKVEESAANNKNNNNEAYGDLSIIGPPNAGTIIDGILDTMFGNYGRRRPSVRVCEVPVVGNANGWWEVYEDDHVKIWGQSVLHRDDGVGDGGSSPLVASACDDGFKAGSVHDEKEDSSSASSSSLEDDDDDDSESDSGSDSDDDSDDDSDEESDDNDDTPKKEEDNHNINGTTTSSSSPSKSDHSIVYIVAMLPRTKQNGKSANGPARGNINNNKTNNINHHQTNHDWWPYSFAIMPPIPRSVQSRKKCPYWQALRNLPQEIVSGRKGRSSSLLDFILHVDPVVDNDDDGNDRSNHCNDGRYDQTDEEPRTKRRRRTGGAAVDNAPVRSSFSKKRVPHKGIVVPEWVAASNLAKHHLATFPDDHLRDHNDDVGVRTTTAAAPATLDEGILIRAQHRSRLLCGSLPFAFPTSENPRRNFSRQQHRMTNLRGKDNGKNNVVVDASGLKSCTSVILSGWKVDDNADIIDNGCKVGQQPFVFVSRIKSIYDRCKDNTFTSWAKMADNEDLSTTTTATHHVQSVKCAFRGETHSSNAQTSRCAEDDNEIDLDNSSSDCDSLQCGESGSENECTNEISREENAIDLTSPHILMLGTGCATPSPLRGSSAYCVFVPTSVNDAAALVLSAMIECGEGTLTGLLRHLPRLHGEESHSMHSKTSRLDVQLSHVNFIWISHAHLDHYGDLPVVVQAIANAKEQFRQEAQEQQPNPLMVIAPSKVLKYLNVLLRGPKDASRNKNIYVGITHREFQHSPFAGHLCAPIFDYTLPMPSFCRDVMQQNHPRYSKTKGTIAANNRYRPFASLRNVEVEHCREAFALILEMNIPQPHTKALDETPSSADQSSFVLCFSGDTRPSDKLVHACRSHSPSQLNMQAWRQDRHRQQNNIPPPPRVSLLIHEATFLNDSHGQIDAVKKRHSTTIEALDVAQKINAEACILTHFSQRYQHISIKDICPSQNLYPFSWGIALDGVMLPLTKRALSGGLFGLSQCVDALMALNDEES